ncbi:MAG: DUF2510 domain-containing protein [Coriobacteriaceae bacterium]|jgi:hypothetical protein|nr:DUF2510 domain-containing protein [Coriobacteriaceae bacterium]
MMPQAGWYPDPAGNTAQLRYWDGNFWTDQYTEASAFMGQDHAPYPPQTPYYGQAARPQQGTDDSLKLIAFVFSLVSTISVGILLVPLIWMVPMTVISWGIYKGTKRNTVAFGVCTLLFVNLISGVLLLCSQKDE